MVKKKAGKPKRKVMRGGNWLGDAWDTIKSGASKVNDFLKSTKAVSTIGSLIPDGRAQIIGKIAGQAGYGKKKRKTQKGRGIKFGARPSILL
jgi:hypothetical protein